MTSEESQDAVEHCPDCGQGYRGYHRCAEGTDRVEFTCSDCEEHIDRERHQMDVAGVPPARCASCTMERMAA